MIEPPDPQVPHAAVVVVDVVDVVAEVDVVVDVVVVVVVEVGVHDVPAPPDPPHELTFTAIQAPKPLKSGPEQPTVVVEPSEQVFRYPVNNPWYRSSPLHTGSVKE